MVLRTVYADPRFWRLAPLTATCIGTAWALQGLWAAPWFSDVERLDRPELLQHLLVMAIALSLGGLLWGVAVDRLRRRGVGPRTLLGLVAMIFIAAQLALILRLPIPSYVPWIVVAAVGAGTVLSYAILAEYFPTELAGRANAALNLFHIGGAFVVQYMTGLVVQLWAPIDGHYPEIAYQTAFAFNVGLQIVAGIWFAAPICSPGYPKIRAACKMACLRITKSLDIPCHVRNQNTLGPDRLRLNRRAHYDVGRDGMDGVAARLSAAARARPGSSSAGCPIYLPPAFFWWWFAYDAYAPDVFVEGACIAASGGIVSIVVAIAMSVWRAREAKTVATYGSARWAEPRDSQVPGLLGADGVVLGRFEGLFLRHDGPEHVLCFAPTRSGKGVGLVVPTLLTWPGSAIVHDIKGENWTLTAGLRARFGRVLLFDPTNAGAQPTIRCSRCGAANGKCATSRTSPTCWSIPKGALERRNHWEKTSHSLLVGSHPARPLCRAGQDAGRRRELPLRSEAADRDHAARDDDDAASRRSRARIPSSRQRRARAAEQERERTLRRAVDRHVVPRPLSRSRRRRR